MEPVQTQTPQNLPQETDQDQMIVQFLQELETRIAVLEDKMGKDVEATV